MFLKIKIVLWYRYMNIFLKYSFVSFLLSQKKGLSFIELISAVGIASVMTVVGVRTYQAKTFKTRTTEAEQSLSFLYTSEAMFKENWGTYHENLVAVGATPSGVYSYDVGFGKSASLSSTDGNLENHPLTTALNVRKCTNFKQICGGDCISGVRTQAGTSLSSYFTAASSNCSITGSLELKTWTGSGGAAETNAKADETAFKAFAIDNLRSDDVWSIDQAKTLTHELDGT